MTTTAVEDLLTGGTADAVADAGAQGAFNESSETRPLSTRAIVGVIVVGQLAWVGMIAYGIYALAF